MRCKNYWKDGKNKYMISNFSLNIEEVKDVNNFIQNTVRKNNNSLQKYLNFFKSIKFTIG